MFVGDDPASADLAEAGGVADEHVKRSAVLERAAKSLKAMAEGDLVIGCDLQVVHFAVDGAIERGEPLGEPLLEGVQAQLLDGGDDVEDQDVIGVMRGSPGDVFGAQRFGPCVDEGPEVRFGPAATRVLMAVSCSLSAPCPGRRVAGRCPVHARPGLPGRPGRCPARSAPAGCRHRQVTSPRS